MAGQDRYLSFEGRQVTYIGTDGSPFKDFVSVSKPLPPGTDLGKGYIPEPDATRNPNTGNPWQGG
jgi:hypothetical protein